MNTNHFISRKDRLLMEAVSASEKASIRLREFATATRSPEQAGPEIICADAKSVASVEITQERYLSLHLKSVCLRMRSFGVEQTEKTQYLQRFTGKKSNRVWIGLDS